VTSLLLVVPVSVAVLHQFGAVSLLTVMLVVLHARSGITRSSRQRAEAKVRIETTAL
jgi:heme A synthase